ncbi:hypothetical protein NEUTE1DRAFT_128403 [Neurospora tetrasperma FGSC 2508]|uniref:Rhodopsin domain-containing protein n=1 Tax=Neurospora tetrasperma (strain FGSC 2508 / ATCC MYA-4615 / P0657) TaxID=510951 RepID=F8MHX1_NEUT8|nr:uncharacterized protein NEUTE1DRAFT_128403 [Neurospora tetrasperma FGSC 2508]EGO58880.1 hypothetical protein NEUTE1DRAFT_128403 [Neurospora tetrasperma FGSC 2508]EGZ72980.1 hypothetical protein NEUTE2DRAFT_156546 [Neurospora tetrasperma FGSC 2509]
MHGSRYSSEAYVLYRSEEENTATPPPRGYRVNEDYGPSMLGAIWTTWSIAVIFVALRFWARSRAVNGLGASDWCILFSLIAKPNELTEIAHGMGKHIWNVDYEANYVFLMAGFWASSLTYFLSLAMTKISICLLYLTIFTVESARRATYAVLVIVCITSVYTIIVICTACVPLRDFWDPAQPWGVGLPKPTCHTNQWYWSCTGLTITTDFLIFLLPIPIVGPLKLPARQKVFVVGIFAVGFVICIVSLVRVFYLYASQYTAVHDITFSTGKLTYWTAIEVHTAIVIACVMTLKPLIVRFFPGFLDPRASNNSSGEQGATGEPTATSSDPPLTVGRRPCRNAFGQRLSWIEVPDTGGQQQQSGPGLTTTTTTAAVGDAALSEIPVSGRGRYQQFLNSPFPLAAGRTSTDSRPSFEMKTSTTTTTTTTMTIMTNYNVTTTSADSIKANSDTTSVSALYREEDVDSTTNLKGCCAHGQSDAGSVHGVKTDRYNSAA